MSPPRHITEISIAFICGLFSRATLNVSVVDTITQDLKFVHVFPRVNTVAAEPASGADGGGEQTADPATLVLTCTLEVLQKQVPRRCVSFTQKQALLKILKSASSTIAGCEMKLAKLETPTDEEQRVFDTAVALSDKITWVQQQMEAQVEAGQLTKSEQDTVVAQLAAKLSEADAAIAAATAEGKPSKAEKVQAARAGIVAKKEAVLAVKPITHAVKYEKELKQLKAQLAELEKIEAARGLQTLDTIKKLREKPGIEQQIADIYAANRGWFEDPEAFEKRMRAASKPVAAAAKPAGSAGGGASAGNGFITQKGGAAKAKASTGKTATSNPWAALGGS